MSIKSALKLVQKGAAAVGKVASKITGTQAKIAAGVGAVVATGVAIGTAAKDIKDSVGAVGNLINGSAAGNVGGLVGDVVPAVAQSFLSTSNMTLTYPKTLNNVELNPAHINFQFFESDSFSKLTSINLPMPDSIKNPNSINWDQGDFGMIGHEVVQGLKKMGSGQEFSTESVEEKMKSIVERVKSLGFYTGMSNIITGAGGNNMSAEDIMGATSGKIPNPYKTMLFRGVDFRSFVFTFQLVPFSESDCDLIHSIVTKFREHSYPDFAADKMFFTYPDECQITYMWETDHNKWLNNFKRAVCTGVDVDFAPRGQWSSLRNGFPNMIEISTRWTEVEIVTKDDIRNVDSQGQRS